MAKTQKKNTDKNATATKENVKRKRHGKNSKKKPKVVGFNFRDLKTGLREDSREGLPQSEQDLIEERCREGREFGRKVNEQINNWLNAAEKVGTILIVLHKEANYEVATKAIEELQDSLNKQAAAAKFACRSLNIGQYILAAHRKALAQEQPAEQAA